MKATTLILAAAVVALGFWLALSGADTSLLAHKQGGAETRLQYRMLKNHRVFPQNPVA